MKDKKGISDVIVWIIGIVLVMLIVVALWAAISAFLGKELPKATSCIEILDSVKINAGFTCNSLDSNIIELSEDERANGNYTLISIDLGDIVLDKVILRIEDGVGRRTTFGVEDGLGVAGVTMYRTDKLSILGSTATIPRPYGGDTYIVQNPEGSLAIKAEIIPVADGQDCGVADSIPLETCSDEITTNVDKWTRDQ